MKELNSIEIAKGLTFNDVLLVPRYSEVLPQNTNVSSFFSRNIRLAIPVVSAAMDTVTGARTAICMAREGGIGVIHKNMSCEAQAYEVRKVKRSESGMITDPITIEPHKTVAQAQSLMKEQGISGLPVVEGKTMVGLVTGRDLRFEQDLSRSISEVMTLKVVSASTSISHQEAVALLHQHRIEKLPILNESKELVGLYTMKDIQKALTFPHASKDSSGSLLAAAAVGAGEQALQRAEALLEAGVDALVVDTAHGHSFRVLETVKELVLKKKRFDFDIVAGNVVTADGVKALIESGADAVKVGVGPGSICTTRIVAGVGVPQLSAIMNCAALAKQQRVTLIADGGIKYSGDCVKALAAGADCVMIGSLIAGTDESPGEKILLQGRTYKSYRGMGSIGAMAQGSKDRYQQENVEQHSKFVPEGIEGRVAYKGSLSEVLYQMVGGIRSALGYLGANTLAELQEQAQFVEISPAGLRESHSHDVYITKEAPNYHVE